MSKSYSYSQLQAAYKCQTYYKLLYIDKLVPKVPKSADLVFGSSFHFALEQYLVHQSDIVKSFYTYWTEETQRINYGRLKQVDLEPIAETLLTRFVRLYAKKIIVKEIEQRLYGKIIQDTGNSTEQLVINVEGTPDVIGSYDGVSSIIDFKTSGYRYPKEKIIINEQMYLYAHLAAQNGHEIKQVVYIVFIKSKDPSIQILKQDITQDRMKKVIDNVINQCHTLETIIKNQRWSYNSNSCQMGDRKCDFFDHCWATNTPQEDK